MKKIINGKRYDTETATMLHEWEHSNRSDFRYCCEALYKKVTGEFFLFGEGGPASPYAVEAGQNSWTGGSSIRRLSPVEAAEWAEAHDMDADAYERAFGIADDDGEKRQVSAWISLASKEALDRLREAGETLPSVIDAGIKALEGNGLPQAGKEHQE